jgi:hypothetical protein
LKTRFIHLHVYLSAIIGAALTSGCITPAFWNHTAAHEWKPGPPDQILLLTGKDQRREVAVMFRQVVNDWMTDEFWVKTNISRNAAWLVGHPSDEVAITPEAMYRFNSHDPEAKSVPLYQQTEVPAGASSEDPGYVVWNPANAQLTVHINGLPSGPFTLPITRQKQKTAKRIIGTPLRVIGDTVIVGCAACFCVVFFPQCFEASKRSPQTEVSPCLYLIWGDKISKATDPFQIYLDDKLISPKTNSAYCLEILPFGNHKITVTSSGKSAEKTITAVVGKSYFFQIETQGSLKHADPSIKEVSLTEGSRLLRKAGDSVGPEVPQCRNSGQKSSAANSSNN